MRKMILKKIFSSMDNVDFRKAVENVRGLRNIKIVTA